MSFNLESALYSIPAVIAGLTIHEAAHATTAYALGDGTAKDQGRISLNPLKHLDPFGLLFIIFAGFGWAKPVEFNKQLLKHPRRDEALIAAAGPISNLVLGLFTTLLLKFVANVLPHSATGMYPVIVNLLLFTIFINFGLFIFNMIPIPPLDGSHVLLSWLNVAPETEARLYRFGMPLLFGILILENITRIDILPIGKLVRFMAKTVFLALGM
ncbi:MAG: site-2 protease family protein [Treponemataceae bacterium]